MTKPSKDLGVVRLCPNCRAQADSCQGVGSQPYIPLQSYTALQVKLDMTIEALEEITESDDDGDPLNSQYDMKEIASFCLRDIKEDQA